MNFKKQNENLGLNEWELYTSRLLQLSHMLCPKALTIIKTRFFNPFVTLQSYKDVQGTEYNNCEFHLPTHKTLLSTTGVL